MSVVKASYSKTAACAVCGRKVTRTQSFDAKDIDPAKLKGLTGSDRTAAVARELDRMGQEWSIHALIAHRACERSTGPIGDGDAIVTLPVATLKGTTHGSD